MPDTQTPSATVPGTEPHPFATLAVVLPATFMQLVDVSIVNVGIPSIQRELGASNAQIQLILAGYQLAFACTLITAARMGDIFGRKKLFLTGMVGFTVASALCGAAPSATVLVIARVLQGLMSGLMFPQVLSVIQVTFPPRERGKAFGIFGATIGLATILGPLLGGALISLDLFGLDWRTIFYVNVPIGIAAAFAATTFLHESRAPDAPRLDLPGAALITASLFLLVFPLTEGRQQGWPSWIFAMLGAALVLLGIFVVYERRKTARDASPLVHMTLFGDATFRRGILLAFVFFGGLPAFFFAITLYLQIGFDFSPLHAGLTTFPFAVGSALSSISSDTLVRRWGTIVIEAGALLLAIGVGVLMAVVHVTAVDMTSWHLVAVLFVCGLGTGLVVAPMINLILVGIHSREAGSASGVLSTGQQVGGALGVALVGIIFFGMLPHNAAAAADRAAPGLRTRLAAAHVPAPAIDGIAKGVHDCLVARASSNNPAVPPPLCRRLEKRAAAGGARGASIGNAIRGYAVPRAKRDSFSHTFAETLIYQLVVFALSLLLLRMLRRPAESGDDDRTQEGQAGDRSTSARV